jgi:hypothetical protein
MRPGVSIGLGDHISETEAHTRVGRVDAPEGFTLIRNRIIFIGRQE